MKLENITLFKPTTNQQAKDWTTNFFTHILQTVCFTCLHPLLVQYFSPRRWMCTAGKCRSDVFMEVINMVHHALLFALDHIWIPIRRGSCSPLQMFHNAWFPRLLVLTLPLLFSSIQSFPRPGSEQKQNVDNGIVIITTREKTSGSGSTSTALLAVGASVPIWTLASPETL